MARNAEPFGGKNQKGEFSVGLKNDE